MIQTRPKILLFTFFILILFISSCMDKSTMREFYLSPSGNDSASGSIQNPWKSIDRLNSEILHSGDRIFFEGGKCFAGTIIIDSSDAVFDTNYLVIDSYGKGRAIIDGGNSAGIHINRVTSFIIKNLIVKGTGRKEGNNSDGVLIEESRDFTIDSLEVYGFQHSGVHIRDCKDAKLINIIAHDNGFAGIHVTSRFGNHPKIYGNEKIYIGYSVAYNNPGDPTVINNHSGNGILASSVKGGMIEYCEAYENGWDMPWTGNGPVGIWIWDCTDFIIQHCIAHHNKTNPVAKDGGGFDLDGGVSNSVIQYCLSYYNHGAGYGLFEFGAAKPWQKNIIRHNVSYNDGLINEGSVAVWKAKNAGIMKDCEIYNNTFVNDTVKGIAVSLITNCEGIIFSDNVFLFTGSFTSKGQIIKNEKFVLNCFWNPTGKVNLPADMLEDNIVANPGTERFKSFLRKLKS